MGWIGFIAGRLVWRSLKKRGSPPPVLSIVGIAVGVLALTVIISVMNGFQQGFIESILEISSYYVRLTPPAGQDALIENIRALPSVRSAVPFRELQVLLRGGYGQQAALIRGLHSTAAEEDPRMAEKLVFEKGSFDLEAEDSILLGTELAARLRLELGDRVELISVGGSGALMSGAELPEKSFFTLRGIFRSGFYEYDLGWGFINFDRAGELEGEDYILGLKLTDRWQDKKAAAAVAALAPAGSEIKTWRDFNRAFFGALRTEKLFMFVLVGLIFIVVGLNIYQAQRRMVLERREEIGLLRAVGAGEKAVRLVFVWDGFVIGLAGAGSGMILGLLFSCTIAAFFTLLENAVNGILSLFQRGGDFAVFSPAVFYIKEIEARVIPREVLLIFLFGLFSALGAAWFASGRVSRIRPAEVLRYE
jgi:lipoprotein-releasing system permease protein